MRHSMEKLTVASGVLISVAVGGCSISHELPSTNCTSFAVSLSEDAHGWPTPEEAAQAWVDGRTEPPAAPAGPNATVSEADEKIVHLGPATLHTMRLHDRSWIVDSGQTCQ